MKDYTFDYSSKTKPFPHQLEAIEFIKGKDFIPLFDEQGLGKTKIVIDSLCQDIENGIVECALIVCKKTLIKNWEDEIKKHSHLSSITLRASTPREKGYKYLAFSHFYIINYAALLNEIERIKMFLKIKKVAIVLDESQKIKTPTSKITEAIFSIKDYSKKRIIITGTPVANKPEDLWAQFYFLDSGHLLGNDFNEFKEKYGISSKSPLEGTLEYESMQELREKINHVSIRRLKADVLELPEKKYIDVIVKMSKTQESIYLELKETLTLEIQNISGDILIDDSSNILKRMLRLIQIASNPKLIDKRYDETPGKFIKLDELINDILCNDEKVIIWSNFVDNILTLKRRYQKYKPQLIFGKMTIDERNKSIERFQNYDEYKLLIANPSAAKEGLTLTKANNAIYLDRNFSLTDYLQSQDRIHRISQEKVCNIIKLVAKGTIDEYIDEILSLKQDIARFIQGDTDSLISERKYLNKIEITQMLG